MVSSTKNRKISENSIFNMIDKAKAKSNGTTPQYEVPNFFSMNDNSAKINNFSQTPVSNEGKRSNEIQSFSSGQFDISEKKHMSFISPTNVSNNSINIVSIDQAKRKNKPILGGGNIFDTKNLESPSRQLIARNFLRDK